MNAKQVHAIVHAIVKVHAIVEKIAGVNGPLLGKLVDRIVHHIATVKTMLKLFLKNSRQQKGKVTINQIKGQSHLWKEIKCLLAEHV